MKLIFLIISLFLTVINSDAQKRSTLIINFNGSAQKLQLLYAGKKISVDPDENGSKVITLKISSPQYIQLYRVPNRPELLYVFPNDKLEMTITGNAVGQLGFKGKHASLNDYLVNPANIEIGGGFTLSEEQYIKFLKNRVDSTVGKMLSNGFNLAFTQKEKKRIASKIYTSMVGYPNIRRRTDREYKPGDSYYSFIKGELYEDNTMLHVKDYTDFIQYMYAMLATKDLERYDAFEYAFATLQYIISNVKSNKIKSHLINYYANDYVRRNGIIEAGPIAKIFNNYVKEKELINKFNETWDTWAKITPGRVMPDMSFRDINNREVSLKSLKGKYVYIDVWATWCKPCIAEIPNLKKMEEKMKDRNITFLSISVDRDGDAWKTMVKEDNFTGLQWHSPNRKFSEELMIVSIPRFILIDPEGKIVEANASRPNRDETYKLFQSLKGL